ncbi:TolC family outer membrane protein [Herbaspirillum sp. 1130]|uniref:TolC family outer membrane protein n=1 Tax=Herbaspirillum sp. 1130 TaxID=2806562 RepID=UPI001AE0EDF8|nr:TolC family outer membrane protein [Herbaspirillum sp. 1130]MBP1318329.1 outer membrane protein [Herbaspirillum sp. 1130]
MRKGLLVVALFCGEIHAQDIVEVYRSAQVMDASFQRARDTLTASQEKLPQARAALLPLISLGGAYSLNNGRADLTETDQPYRWKTKKYALVLSQPIFDYSSWKSYEQSKKALVADEITFLLAQQDLILRICDGYFSVLNAQDRIDAIRATKRSIEEELMAAREGFRKGTSTIIDQREAEAQFDLSSVDELAEINNLELKKEALRKITQKPISNLMKLPNDVNIVPPVEGNIEYWFEASQKGNLNANLQAARLEVARVEVEKVKAGYLPTVSLSASAGASNQLGRSPTLESGRIKTNAVEIQINIPIFSGYSTESKVREAVALRSQAEDDLELAIRNGQQDIQAAYLDVKSGIARINALETVKVSSASVLESMRLGYKLGVKTYIDVLKAQRQLSQAELNLSKSRYDTILAYLRLRASAGMLTEEDIVQVNSLLSVAEPE